MKKVINDDNGTAQPSDWTLSAEGQTPMSGPGGRKSAPCARSGWTPASYG